MSVVTTKLVNPEVPYLSDESLRAHTNAVLTCTDGVRLRTSKLLLAAHSPLMRRVMLENDHSQASTLDLVKIKAQGAFERVERHPSEPE